MTRVVYENIDIVDILYDSIKKSVILLPDFSTHHYYKDLPIFLNY